MPSARILLKFTTALPKSFLFRQALYFGINSSLLDKKSKPEIFQLSEDKLKSTGLTGKYIAVYFFIKNGSIYLLPSHILKVSEEKKVEPKNIRSYTTIIHYFKTNPNYSQYLLKSKTETSDVFAKKEIEYIEQSKTGPIRVISSYKMSYDPTLDKSVVDLENFNYEESEIDSASDTEDIKSENSESVAEPFQDGNESLYDFQTLQISNNNKKSILKTSNNLTIKDLKNHINVYDEKRISIDSWIDSSVYIAELANCRDEKLIIATLLSKLPEDTLGTVRAELAVKYPKGENLNLNEFRSLLIKICEQSQNEMARSLEEMKYDPIKYKTFKEFYLRLLQKVTALHPKLKSKPDELKIITSQYFKRKMPISVRQNLNFELSELQNFELVELAQRIYNASQRVQSNNFRANTRYIKNSKPFNGIRNFRQNRPNFTQKQRVVNRYQPKPFINKTKFTGNCHFCSKYGHKKSDCFAFQNRSRGNGFKKFQ